jgi:hypothetical protein
MTKVEVIVFLKQELIECQKDCMNIIINEFVQKT